MTKKYMNLRIVFLILASLLKSNSIAGKPVWSFTPLTRTSIEVPSNGSGVVQYKITNESSRSHTLKLIPLNGVIQKIRGPEICGSTFTLPAKGTSCILFLIIRGDILSGSISDGPIVCESDNINQCYRPSSPDILRIIKTRPSAQATITVTGSPLILTADGNPGSLTINNTSLEIPAFNIDADLSNTALYNNLTETDNTCYYLSPGDSCTITFTPGNSMVNATQFPILGTNTNTVLASITINPGLPTITRINPNAGSSLGGTTVTLTGTFLTTTTTVTFDGIDGTNLQILDDTHLTIVTPPHAEGFVDIEVTTSVGSYILPNSYHYENLPTLETISAPINSQPPCNSVCYGGVAYQSRCCGTDSGGTGFTVTGTNLSGTTALTFDGIPAIGINIVNSTTITAVTPAHSAGLVDVTVTTPNGTATLSNGFTYQATQPGQYTQGGVIGCYQQQPYLNLIAADQDISNSVAWDASSTLQSIGPDAQSGVNGSGNTQAIVNFLGTNPGFEYAALLCSQYEVDSQRNTPCLPGNICYADWYLPALNQLDCFFTNRIAIGGLFLADYWSSTEAGGGFSVNRAWGTEFTGGLNDRFDKTLTLHVRCARDLIQTP